MSRHIGIKQDSMLYKGRVIATKDGMSRTYSESGPYPAYGTAAQVASCVVNECNRNARRFALRNDTYPEVYTYKVVRGRMIWFEEEK